MCGIIGLWDSSMSCEDLTHVLGEAVAALHHRGPDGSGTWMGHGGIGLGHTRLAILDLSKHGCQPMCSEDGRYVLVFNGEVYNFREIRANLIILGHSFVGDGDSEVVLASFSEWGIDCVDHFIGMFAFAVWDQLQRSLYLCRDRVGVKPLYYLWDGKVLCFASELKALCEFRHWAPELDRQAMGEYFQYGYIAAPRSIYQNVQKLLPAHWLILKEGGAPLLQRYWSVMDAVNKGYFQEDEDALTERLEELLISSFKYRMVSDVPVGVFLSGGIDSSLVAAILQKHSGQRIRTFTIGFNEDAFDESQWARRVARHLGTEHTEFILGQGRAEELLSLMPRLYDEPFGDDSAIPCYMVSKLAHEKVKVALSADGGDELFGGYSSYILNPERLKKISSCPYWLRNFSGKSISLATNTFREQLLSGASLFDTKISSDFLRKLKKLEYVLSEPNQANVFAASESHWLPEEVSRLIGGYSDPRRSLDAYPGQFEERMMLSDFEYSLPDQMLAKIDRASMAVSLEVREPMLDHRLIEFAFRLPLQYKIGSLGSKHLLRKVLYKYLPREFIERPKQGFSIPKNIWLWNKRVEIKQSLLDRSSPIANILDRKTLEDEVRMHGRTGANENRIWLLYTFSQWLTMVNNGR